MMLFCYLQIKPLDEIAFTHKWKKQLQHNFPDLVFIEADNHSDPYLAQESARLISQADKIVCLLDVSAEVSPGSISKILEVLRKTKNPQIHFLQGENKAIGLALKMLKAPILPVQSDDQLMGEMNDFLRI